MELSDLYPPSRYVECPKCGALYAGKHLTCGLSKGVPRSATRLAEIAEKRMGGVLQMRAKAGER